MKLLYFAYGSNMSSQRIGRRINSARKLVQARLDAHRLVFHKVSLDGSGKCDIHATELSEDYVLGVVYEISAEDKLILDGYEGVGSGYEVKQVCVTDQDGQKLECFAYYATHIDSAFRPYHWYKEHVLRGAEQQGFPVDYLEKIQSIISMDDPDPVRHADEMSHYE